MKEKALSGGRRGAVDPHTHIYPYGFIEDVRKARFGRTITIAPAKGKGFEWIITRGKILGKEVEAKYILTPLEYRPDLRFKDMERMGVERQILSISPPMMLYSMEAAANKESSPLRSMIA